MPLRGSFKESGCLGMQPKMGGKFHLKLNIGTRPIANKYCEGKMKSTLKRELRARETVKGEAIGASSVAGVISLRVGSPAYSRSASTGCVVMGLPAGVLVLVAGQHRFPGVGESSRGGNQLRLMLKPVVLPRWRPRQAAVCAIRLGQLCLGGRRVTYYL